MKITSFSHEGYYYQLYFNNAQYSLTASPPAKYFNALYGKTAPLYYHDELVDDLGTLQNAFAVITESINAIASHVTEQKLSYFYFASSTDRKEKIYEWVAKKLIAQLATLPMNRKATWDCSWQEGRFYFWKYAD